MKERLDKLEALYRINETILSILDVNKLLDKVLHIIENTFGFDSCAILFYDENTDELYIRTAVGYKPEMIKKFRTTIGGKGITGYVAKTKEPLYIPNIEVDSRHISGMDGAKSEIAIPLIVEQKLIGVLDIESKKEYSFTEDDFNVLCMFANQITQAINNVILIEKERKKVSQLLVLNKIKNRISVSLELDKLLDVVASSIIEFFSYYQVLIFLYQEEAQKLGLMAHSGIKDVELEEDFEDKLTNQIVGESFYKNKIIIVNSKINNPFKSSIIKGVQSEFAIPLKIQENPIGVIYIASESKDTFDEKDIHIMEAISEQLSINVRDAFIFTKISKKSKQLDVVHKIGQVAIQSFDLKELVNDIVDFIQKNFGFYHVSVFSYEETSQELELLAYAGASYESFKVGDKFSITDGIIGYVVRSKEYYLSNDVLKEDKYNDMLVHTKSELTLPIKHENKIFGVMNIESSKLNQFDKSDVEIFTRITDQIAYTIANADLFKQKSSAHTLLLSLNNLGREINSTFDLQKILSLVIKKLPIYVQCRLCSIFFYYPDENKLVLMSHNLPDMKNDEGNVAQNILMKKVIRLKHSIYVKDIESELNIRNRPQYQTKSFLNILIKHYDRIIGVLNLTDKLDSSYFTYQEFYLINSFCEHLTTAIINSEKYQKILELSITDGLTGLYVHRYFQDALLREIARVERCGNSLSLIMLDIDNFKTFNDTYGHQIGDIVLREVAVLIKKELREYDIATRYGGEEFGIILPNTSLFLATAVAERLRKSIEKHSIMYFNEELKITISIGVSEYTSGLTKHAFIEQADSALLRAKAKGKNIVIAFPD